MKKSEGITLIALVITIIVMLILAAVTITMAVNGGLFGYAQNASRDTADARDLEQNFADLGDNLTYEDLIAKYTGARTESADLNKLRTYFVQKNLTDLIESEYDDDENWIRDYFKNIDPILDASEKIINIEYFENYGEVTTYGEVIEYEGVMYKLTYDEDYIVTAVDELTETEALYLTLNNERKYYL